MNMHVYSLPITILDALKPTQAPVKNLFLSDKRLYLVLMVSLIGSIFSFTEPQRPPALCAFITVKLDDKTTIEMMRNDRRSR